MPADVAAVINALDCGPVHTLGHAYGNRVTRCLAVDRSELVRSLLLLAAPGSAKAADREVASVLADWTRDDATEAACIKVLEAMVGDPANAPSIWRQLRRDPALAREQSATLRSPPIDHYESGGDKYSSCKGSRTGPLRLRMLANYATGIPRGLSRGDARPRSYAFSRGAG